MAHLKDFIGKRLGNLTIIEFSGWKHGARFWKCQCDCGLTFIVHGENMERGKIKSCGCMRDPKSKVFIMNAEKKLLSLIEKEESCWIWKGNTRSDLGKGFYPYCNFNHEQLHPVKFFKKMLGEECPKNWTFKKKCYSKKCVNPAHYELTNVSRIRYQKLKEENDRRNEKL